ncbi:MAG: hypothetical protein GY795_13510 [Desulfobacterales bacterium]|nr:hypothetical protein [Desulfobacterales bacterium]
MKTKTIALGCFICVFVLMNSGNVAAFSYNHVWIQVLRGTVMIEDACVKAVDSNSVDSNRIEYELTFQGWGYYNKTIKPGTYNIYINDELRLSSVKAEPFDYVIMTVYVQ